MFGINSSAHLIPKGRFVKICIVALALSGCGHVAPPEPRIVTKVVMLPVQVKCDAKLPPAPDYPDTDEALAAVPDIFVAVQLFKAGRALRIAREAQQDAALKGCAG